MELSTEYLAWVAGFFDGEGSVSISYIKVSGQYYLHARITQNIEEIIKDIAKNFEITTVYRDKDYPKYNAKRPNWRLLITNKKGYNFLKAIYPYLKVKRAQAEIGMKFQEMLHSDLPQEEKNRLKPIFKEQIEAITASPIWVA